MGARHARMTHAWWVLDGSGVQFLGLPLKQKAWFAGI